MVIIRHDILVYSLSNKISLLATTLASRVFGLLGFCWSPELGGAAEIGKLPVVAVPWFGCGSPLGDTAPFALCSVFSFFGSATEKKKFQTGQSGTETVDGDRASGCPFFFFILFFRASSRSPPPIFTARGFAIVFHSFLCLLLFPSFGSYSILFILCEPRMERGREMARTSGCPSFLRIFASPFSQRIHCISLSFLFEF